MNTSDEKKKKIKNYLESFDYISVREIQGQKFIKELLNQEVPVVVDPTLLLNEKIWKEYANKKIEKIEQKYVFCYLLTPNEKYIQAVSEFAKQRNLQVIIVPTSKGPFETGFKEIIDVGPSEWLGLIKNATYVCTDSFHGCIFSAIFHREFILFKRFKDKDKASENSRIYTLANMLEVEDRIVDEGSVNNIDKVNPLDFEKIDRIIADKARESKEWLLNALKKVGA